MRPGRCFEGVAMAGVIEKQLIDEMEGMSHNQKAVYLRDVARTSNPHTCFGRFMINLSNRMAVENGLVRLSNK